MKTLLKGRFAGLMIAGAALVLISSYQNCSMQSPNGSAVNASLKETDDIVFDSVPSDLNSYPGATINARVDATSKSGLTLTYKWFKDGVELIGLTSNTLAIASAANSDQGLYKLEVRNSKGYASAQFSVTIGAIPLINITQQPVPQTGQAGASVNLNVIAVASDNQSLKYQWYKDGTALAGFNTPTLSLTNLAPANAGVYSVEVSGAVTPDAKVRSSAVRLYIQATLNVLSATGCVNGYCACYQPSKADIVDSSRALAICNFKGYPTLGSFTVAKSPLGATVCAADGTGCLANGTGAIFQISSIVCNQVVCSK